MVRRSISTGIDSISVPTPLNEGRGAQAVIPIIKAANRPASSAHAPVELAVEVNMDPSAF
jgi:hypothetical protein